MTLYQDDESTHPRERATVEAEHPYDTKRRLEHRFYSPQSGDRVSVPRVPHQANGVIVRQPRRIGYLGLVGDTECVVLFPGGDGGTYPIRDICIESDD